MILYSNTETHYLIKMSFAIVGETFGMEIGSHKNIKQRASSTCKH